MDLKRIAEAYLKTNGYDGLYNDLIACGCEISDLMCCNEPSNNCQPGFKQKCNPETCEFGGDCEFHMGAEKDPTASSIGGKDE